MQTVPMHRHELARRTIVFQAVLLAAVSSLFALAMYLTVQHVLRSSANDPQFQMASDAAAQLEQGADPATLVGLHQIDMARSLVPFLIVYDANGAPLATSARLNGSIPKPPSGVFRYASEHQQNVLTWQPQPGVRIAAVVRAVSGPHAGFVLAGRSLRLVEERIRATVRMVALAWLVMMAVVVTATVLFASMIGKEPASED